MTISTLVDTDILLDILNADSRPEQQHWSSLRLDEASDHGSLCLSAVSFAEISQPYSDERVLLSVLRPFGFAYEPFPFEAAYPAGRAHRLYRQRGGRRERTLPDFLVGAHAAFAGHRLLTRDASRYRDYFPDLLIICPETHP
ncbi:PIN domain-containing protein [Aureimonas flava]|uniref:PIN domain-containing protein n=1 Tax=Aureimonas flava TaxID=2320271 RepID=A0A3A1WHU0_9HYPH|nr:type II toxin-antitoxin system VapC family toxin [Aureimonas flava]RIX98751.1 PIN domain-containing protein [Aureimonas flava]